MAGEIDWEPTQTQAKAKAHTKAKAIAEEILSSLLFYGGSGGGFGGIALGLVACQYCIVRVGARTVDHGTLLSEKGSTPTHHFVYLSSIFASKQKGNAD